MSGHFQSTASAALRFPLFRAFRWPGRRVQRLDRNTLPDYLKRDLGFSGGRSSPVRDPLRD